MISLLLTFPSPQRFIQNRGSMRDLCQSGEHVQDGQELERCVHSAHRPGPDYGLEVPSPASGVHNMRPVGCFAP